MIGISITPKEEQWRDLNIICAIGSTGCPKKRKLLKSLTVKIECPTKAERNDA